MAFIIKTVGYGLGALLAAGGMLMISVGTTTGNTSTTSSGWDLVIAAIIMWAIGFVVRESHNYL